MRRRDNLSTQLGGIGAPRGRPQGSSMLRDGAWSKDVPGAVEWKQWLQLEGQATASKRMDSKGSFDAA